MPSRMPPAALVSTTVRQPAAAAVRTPCTTGVDAVALVEVGAAEQHQHVRSPTGTDRIVPPCPATAGGTKPGSSAIGISAAGAPMTSAAGRQPEPSTTATSCVAMPVASARWAAAAAESVMAAAYGRR